MFDRMPPNKLARAKGQTNKTNELNALAHLANGYGGNGQGCTGAESRIAQELLIDRVGLRKAKRLMDQSVKRVIKDTF
ncbi:hypothetical protein [Nonomuraea sp. NPDC050643]|uniref:hypothetical protein n=1 Tax=Nonomuraea sp. NPDC050643 TaxID=3155660 RepID=UPI0033C8F173